ncbi:hypothetical protein B0T24DRAFT_3093 [Lasiosphaeria ovina]|uniref:Uncharacterized protein n=1 Tax=Lasiosphaeria ovina TaxID=92902 RepID=A0AAE0NIJ1_9PEZI|nr:hypothetical protein B0T24DRAFT_3093 [Lasiosphaeria ovina]
MTTAANAAVRESRRRSTPLDIEQVNVMKALTAAEYSRRQFVLNFAASKDTRLLIPGQKADAIKAAEESVVVWMSQNGFGTVTNDYFKYTVDMRLWTTLVGEEIEFPFAFMAGPSRESDVARRPKSEAFPVSYDEVSPLDLVPVERAPTLPPKLDLPEAQRPRRLSQQHPAAQQSQQPEAAVQPPQRQRPSKGKRAAGGPEKRSLSLSSVDDLKMAKKLNQDKFPFLMRLGRSWSRRMS